jgi:hypothetical protein
MSTEATIKEAGRIREAARAEFVRLARSCSQGDTIEPGEINRVASESGREVAEFASLVRSLKNRAELRVKAAHRQEIEQELAAIEATANAEAAILNQAIAKHERVISPLGRRQIELFRQLAECRETPADLARSCPCPILNSSKLRLEIEGRQLQEQYRDAQGEIERLQGQLTQLDRNSEDAARFTRAIGRAEVAVSEIAARVKKNSAAYEANFRARIDF